LAVRIYALAKQLKVDNQALIDACKKAGITVKGSALASLSDDEVAQVKAFLSSGKAARAASQETAAATAPGGRGPMGSTAVRPGAGLAAGPGEVVRREDYITASYAALYRKHCEARGQALADMGVAPRVVGVAVHEHHAGPRGPGLGRVPVRVQLEAVGGVEEPGLHGRVHAPGLQ